MANEVVTSGLERANAVLSARRLLLLADRAVLGAHSAIFEAGSLTGANNTTTKIPRQGLDGYNRMAAGSEASDTANTAYTDASTNVAVGRYDLSYDVSTMTVGTDSELSWQRFAQSLMISAMLTETEVCAALATGFSTSVGSQTSEMSLTTFLTSISTLEGANVPGPYLFVGHTAHRRGLRLEQLLSVGGQAQYQAPVGTAIGTGYGGNLWGVDLFFSNLAPASGSGKGGMMVGQGAIARVTMSPPVNDPSRQTVMDNIMIEYARQAGASLDEYHGHLWVGYAENDDARGVLVECKA